MADKGKRPKAHEPLSRLALDIPKTLHTRIKVASAVQQRSMRDVLIEVLERHFPSDDAREESPSEPPTRAPDERSAADARPRSG